MPDDATLTSSTAYEPSAIEARWYPFWEEGGFFHAEADPEKPAFCVMMPPPNVTGRLHMGHALQDTVQDLLTRVFRMRGYDALWMPGLDHAGIATQNVVERTLKKEEGKTRHDLGRERFVERVWDWKDEYGGIILQQKRRLGASCDWRRTRFTMDEGFSRAVQDVFVRLYEEGLVYRGLYLVNWDPENETALSDEEVENVERDGHLWHIRYPVLDESGEPTGVHITIATTRPETLLGDTAVAVHPEDERYQALVGRKVLVPFVERAIPVIADEYVKPEFGAGALKITPAHDPNDFEIGQRHNLETITVVAPDGTLNAAGGPFVGQDRFEARKAIVAELEARGQLVKTEPYKHTVPISSRSKAVIEPLLSQQWFVKMEGLAEPAIEAVKDGEVTFHPSRWANEYFRWMESIRDWCISRQLWWGHRIPVWYHTDEHGQRDESRAFVVSVDQPEPGMVQDEDVLDTWFSSWLWPFATFGWPDLDEDAERDLQHFYPTTVLVSGYDILFFWIARMMMAGEHFMQEKPFGDVYITGMIKDAQGRWMSKSLGNGIDPLDMIEQYGADAVRFSLAVLCAQGQDIKLDPSKFEMGRNFANKIWNAFRVFSPSIEEGKRYQRQRSFEELDLVEQWMLSRFHGTVRAVDEALSRYRINEAALLVYDAFWRDYCDWYLELIKPPRREDGSPEPMDEDKVALAVELYEGLLKLLHPFMPFITEELYHKVRPREEDDALIVAAWPEADDASISEEVESRFALVQELVSGVRGVRSQYNVPPSQPIRATVSLADEASAEVVEGARRYFEGLAGVEDLTVGTGLAKPKASAAVVAGGHEVFVPLAGMIDLDQERERLQKEIDQKEDFWQRVQKKLQNEQFVTKAPFEVVERERQKARDAEAELERLRANLADLEGV